jgi:hypothetical protein
MNEFTDTQNSRDKKSPLFEMDIRVRFPAKAMSLVIASTSAEAGLNFFSNRYRRLFPRVESGRGVKLTTNFHTVPMLRMHRPIF